MTSRISSRELNRHIRRAKRATDRGPVVITVVYWGKSRTSETSLVSPAQRTSSSIHAVSVPGFSGRHVIW